MREQVVQALIAKLKAAPEIKQVISYADLDRLAMTGLPAVMVVDAGEVRFPLTGDYVQVALTVAIHGVVASAEETETRMNELDDVIKKTLAADRTLGGLVSGLMIEPREETDLLGDEAVAAFVRPVVIHYSGNESQGV